MPPSQQSVDAFIFSILNGKTPAWPAAANPLFADDLGQVLHQQGLYPLTYHLCKDTAAWKTWPAEMREKATKTAIQQAAHELNTEAKTRDLLTKFQAVGIRPIVLKGSAIAYTHYCEKSTRIRGDIDLLFRRDQLSAAFHLLEKKGYGYSYRQGYLGQELGYVDTAPQQKTLPLDIHWRSSSYVLLAHVLDYDEILRSAIRIPELAPSPCAMNPVHALLHACVHWAKHAASGDSIRILWLYDMHLLAKGLSNTEIQRFIDSAINKKISRICQAALTSVHQKLPCANMEVLLAQLNRLQQHEPSARILRSDAHSFAFGDMFSRANLAALPRILQDVFIPPGAFMLRFYDRKHPLWLPLLYTHRLLAGLLEYGKRSKHA